MDFKSYEARLAELEREYEHRKHNFVVMVENEITTTCFERNAIADLAIMLELKSQIKVLRTIITNWIGEARDYCCKVEEKR